MRHIHISALVGLLLNCLMMFYIYSTVVNLPLVGLSPDERVLLQALGDAIEAFKGIIIAMLIGQAIGLGLIAMRIPGGIHLAIASAVLMCPAGLVFIIGSLLSNAAARYSGILTVSGNAINAANRFEPAWKKTLGQVGLAFGGTSVLMFLINVQQIPVIFLGSALAVGALYYRCIKTPALAVANDHCVLSPTLFAPRLLLPFKQIRLATLNPEGTLVGFEVETPEGVRAFVWPVASVAPALRRKALEELGSALHAAQVRME